MIGKLNARLYRNGRCAFEWSYTYAGGSEPVIYESKDVHATLAGGTRLCASRR